MNRRSFNDDQVALFPTRTQHGLGDVAFDWLNRKINQSQDWLNQFLRIWVNKGTHVNDAQKGQN